MSLPPRHNYVFRTMAREHEFRGSEDSHEASRPTKSRSGASSCVWAGVAAAGTGFLLAPQVLVTCHHCVAAELETGEYWAALDRDNGRYVPHELSNVEQALDGADLALATVHLTPRAAFGTTAGPPGLQLSHDPVLTGGDVFTYGYPLVRNRLTTARGWSSTSMPGTSRDTSLVSSCSNTGGMAAFPRTRSLTLSCCFSERCSCRPATHAPARAVEMLEQVGNPDGLEAGVAHVLPETKPIAHHLVLALVGCETLAWISPASVDTG